MVPHVLSDWGIVVFHNSDKPQWPVCARFLTILRPVFRNIPDRSPSEELKFHGQKSGFKSLYFQVIVAIAIGVLLGHFYPETGAAMKPLGDGFIKLIKMIIAPIIFCTIVVGIAGMEDMKKVGKTGGLAVLVF
jgi:hypothetical protein